MKLACDATVEMDSTFVTSIDESNIQKKKKRLCVLRGNFDRENKPKMITQRSRRGKNRLGTVIHNYIHESYSKVCFTMIGITGIGIRTNCVYFATRDFEVNRNLCHFSRESTY